MPSINNLGAEFPNLSVETQLGPLRVWDYQGDAWLVFFSHPNDYTPVCTTELGEAARHESNFMQRGVKLMALSCDSVDDHIGWIADIAAASGSTVNFPIISDANREIAVLLGMLDDDEKDSAGIPATVRKLFIVGPDRKIKLVITYPTAVGRSFPEILRVIDALQLAAKFPIATPVNWERGGDVMIQPTVSDADAKVRHRSRDS